jgi:hypothetical protein
VLGRANGPTRSSGTPSIARARFSSVSAGFVARPTREEEHISAVAPGKLDHARS